MAQCSGVIHQAQVGYSSLVQFGIVVHTCLALVRLLCYLIVARLIGWCCVLALRARSVGIHQPLPPTDQSTQQLDPHHKHVASVRCQSRPSPEALIKSLLLPRVDEYLVWKWILVASQDGRDVVFVSVHDGDNLHGGFLQRSFHGAPNLDSISFGARFGNDDLDDPFFPAYLFLRLVSASKSPEPSSGHARLSSLTVEQLNHDLTSRAICSRIRGRRGQLAD